MPRPGKGFPAAGRLDLTYRKHPQKMTSPATRGINCTVTTPLSTPLLPQRR